MFAYLEGKLVALWDNNCLVLTTGGVGYALILPAHTLASLPKIGEQVAFYTALSVREDALKLFGFATLEERRVFEVLLSVSKVGTRTALAILSVYRPAELYRLILEENVNALARIPGIGQKTAQHILLELKDKLKNVAHSLQTTGSNNSNNKTMLHLPVYQDVLDALANLGYKHEECKPVLTQILKEEPDLDVSEAIRKTLKGLASLRT